MKHLLRRVLYFLSKYFIHDITPIARRDVIWYKRYNWRDISTVQVIDVDESAVVDAVLLLLEVKIDK